MPRDTISRIKSMIRELSCAATGPSRMPDRSPARLGTADTRSAHRDGNS